MATSDQVRKALEDNRDELTRAIAEWATRPRVSLPRYVAPIPVREWWDVFTFTGDNQLECPDCETVSPPFRDIYAAVEWVNDHYTNCKITDRE